MFLEFGETVRKGRASLDKAVPLVLERLRERLPPFLIALLEEQHHRLSDLDEQINGIEKQLKAVAKQNEACQKLLEIPGVGPLIATAAVATMGEVSAFKSGREFAAYVGLVLKQTGSGGKVAKWRLNRSRFGIRIDHDLACISDRDLASQSIMVWHPADHSGN